MIFRDWRRTPGEELEPRGWMLDTAMWLCLGGLFTSCFSVWALFGVVAGVLVFLLYCSLPWKRCRGRRAGR